MYQAMTVAARSNLQQRRPIRRAAVFVGLLAVGALSGWIAARANSSSDAISPVHVEQFYGVAAGLNAEGEFCIVNSATGERCAVLRLASGTDLPPDGSPVRGGLARLPSDTSDTREPSWLWVSEIACGWKGTEKATLCPNPAP